MPRGNSGRRGDAVVLYGVRSTGADRADRQALRGSDAVPYGGLTMSVGVVRASGCLVDLPPVSRIGLVCLIMPPAVLGIPRS